MFFCFEWERSLGGYQVIFQVQTRTTNFQAATPTDIQYVYILTRLRDKKNIFTSNPQFF